MYTLFLVSSQNHLSGGGTCQVDDRTYQLEMSLFIGDDIETMTNEDFCPQGMCMCVLDKQALKPATMASFWGL